MANVIAFDLAQSDHIKRLFTVLDLTADEDALEVRLIDVHDTINNNNINNNINNNNNNDVKKKYFNGCQNKTNAKKSEKTLFLWFCAKSETLPEK